MSYLKVRFCQKILMFLSYLQTNEHSLNLKIWTLVTENYLEIEDVLNFTSLNLKIWILVTGNYLEIEDVLKFESLEACKAKRAAFDWLGRP